MPFQPYSMKLRIFPMVAAVGVAVVMSGTLGSAQPQLPFPQALPYALFERYLEALRQEGGIPGLSAAIIRNGQIGWTAGFGREDIGKAIAASPDTPYPIGGMTQAISSLLVGICIDRYQFNIDQPIRQFAKTFPEESANVRNVLAHSSEGAPSFRYRYDPALFSSLTPVVDNCGQEPYRRFLAEEIIERFALAVRFQASTCATCRIPRGSCSSRLSRPVRRHLPQDVGTSRVDRLGNATQSEFPMQALDASSGMVSSVYDLAQLDRSLDSGFPVSLKTLNDMWSPATFGTGSMPTGLGWFVQTTSNERLVWQFSLLPDASSGIWLRIPNKHLTLILLANSAGLTSGLNLERGDITASPFVRVFLGLFL